MMAIMLYSIGGAILLMLLLVVLRISQSKKEEDYTANSRPNPMVHASGIYSIVRNSPEEALIALRPNDDTLRKHLESVNEDVKGTPLDVFSRDELFTHFKEQMRVNLQEIEEGDKNGTVFYYYDFKIPCPVCAEFINKGNFISREEIYNHPQIIPPLHLGCTARLIAHSDEGNERLRETLLSGSAPFFSSGTVPPLPEWTSVISLSAKAEA